MLDLPEDLKNEVESCPYIYEWINHKFLDQDNLHFDKNSLFSFFEPVLIDGNPIVKTIIYRGLKITVVLGQCDKTVYKSHK